MVKIITSLVNPMIKDVILLSEKSKVRRERNLCVVEGLREISLAVKGGYSLRTLIFNPSIVTYNTVLQGIGSEILDVETLEVTNQIYNKLAYREGTEGVIAIFETLEKGLTSLTFKRENPLVLIAEAPEKPGNIGALLRTADAGGVDAVIIANPLTDLYNPNIIRSSVGTLFTNQLATGQTDEIIKWLGQRGFNMFGATLSEESVDCYTQDYTAATAIIVGAESEGLSDSWVNAVQQNIKIPMAGQIDSMNVSVSAAILIFEAVRQRSLKRNSNHSLMI